MGNTKNSEDNAADNMWDVTVQLIGACIPMR